MNRIYRFHVGIAPQGQSVVIDLPRMIFLVSMTVETRSLCGQVQIRDGANILFELSLAVLNASWPPLDMDTTELKNPELVLSGLAKDSEFTVYLAEEWDEIEK